MRLVLILGLAVTCLPAFAAADKKPAKSDKSEKPAAAAAAVEDDEDDDILAPVRGEGDRPATVVPVKAKDIKVGLLTLVPLGDSGKTLGDQLTGEITKAFNESASVEVVALQMSSGTGVVSDASAAEAAKKEGDELLAKSQALLQKLQFGKAKKGYELAIAAYEKAAAVLETPDVLIDSWLGLAEVAARQAQDDETRRCLSIVVAFNPEKELDKKRFPGLFVTAHKKARDALLKGERSKIFVDETATGAKVFVDGRETTTAPARLTGLLPGHHLVRAVREGQPPWGSVVVVPSPAEGAGAEVAVSPGFLAKDKKGPGEDLAQNKLSPEAAATVAEAARAQGLKGAVVGAAEKTGGKVLVQLVYVDAASGQVALLPQVTIQAALLDVGIESLKARTRLNELASAEKPELAAADGDEPLIEGARAGAGVQVTELAIKYDVKVSKDAPNARAVTGADDDEEKATDEDPDAERTVAESKTGKRKRLDEEKDRYSSKDDGEVDEDASFTSQPWFLPVVIGGGVVAAVVVLGATGAGLVAGGVIPDPRPANGAQVVVSVPTAAAP